MKKIASLLTLVLAFSVVPFVGCGGPQAASEDEAMQGMDNIDSFADEAEVEGGDLDDDESETDADL